jgi:hypothetical protein
VAAHSAGHFHVAQHERPDVAWGSPRAKEAGIKVTVDVRCRASPISKLTDESTLTTNSVRINQVNPHCASAAESGTGDDCAGNRRRIRSKLS